MPHRLASLRTTIDDEPVASLQLILPRKTIGKLHDSTHQQCMRLGELRKGWNMLGGNQEKMRWGLRVNIFQREQPFSLCHNIRWKGSIHDTAEEALRPTHPIGGTTLQHTSYYQSTCLIGLCNQLVEKGYAVASFGAG